MRLRIVTVGRPARDAQRLADPYLRRLDAAWPTEVLHVVEERLSARRSESEVLRKEAARIREKLPAGWNAVALDRTGRQMDSSALAEQMRAWEQGAVRGISFLIGGPVGLDPTLVEAAHLRLSFGPMTFAHDLAFVMLCEQLYRALTITRGWPYHR